MNAGEVPSFQCAIMAATEEIVRRSVMYGLKTEASFDSAHFLTDYYGKCENLHGHRWRMVVRIESPDLQADGTMKDMVMDFGVFKRAVRALAEELDHTFDSVAAARRCDGGGGRGTAAARCRLGAVSRARRTRRDLFSDFT